MSGTILKVLIIILLLYCFVGIWSFIPYFLGILQSAFTWLIDIVAYNIYPVGKWVYIVHAGFLLYLFFYFIVTPFFKD